MNLRSMSAEDHHAEATRHRKLALRFPSPDYGFAPGNDREADLHDMIGNLLTALTNAQAFAEAVEAETRKPSPPDLNELPWQYELDAFNAAVERTRIPL